MSKVQKVKFLLVSKQSESANQIRDELLQRNDYAVDHVDSADVALKKIKKGNFDCLIFNFDRFDMDQVTIVQDIRALGYSFQMLVFSDLVSKSAEEACTHIPRVGVFLKGNIDVKKDIVGLASRCLNGDEVSARRSPRHATLQRSVVENARTGETFLGWVLNLSTGGAYVEVATNSLRLGEGVIITVQLDQLGKAHRIQGYVAWVAHWQDAKSSVGIQFKKAESKAA